MTDRSIDLGHVDPAGSRQLGRRSSVCLSDDSVVVGLADGSVAAFDADTLDERWRDAAADAGSVVSLVPFGDAILAGERGEDGTVRLLDADTGAERWRYRTATDVGAPTKQTRFFLPFVVDAVTDGERAYVASRRYERGQNGDRNFESVVYAFDADGTVVWQFETDASPIALDARGGRIAVGYNRCPGVDRDGLLVLDADTGVVRRRWNPPGDGDRRVGDVSLVDTGIAVASHADYRGYLLDDAGVRWATGLARPVERGDDTVYAYPNHVHATDDGVAFFTGNTYPEKGRETDARHPAEHAAIGVGPDGDRRWKRSIGGFAHEVATDGGTVAVPVAQHFRNREPDVHALQTFEIANGRVSTHTIPGVLTAAAVTDDRFAAIEEPVAYHDADDVRGAYRLRC